MNNIHNFANRQLCEYQSIFPTVAALLDHLLFTNGNGYDFDSKTGMIVDNNGRRLDEYPMMFSQEWDTLIADCHAKELNFAQQCRQGKEINQEALSKKCAEYKRVSVKESDFIFHSLLADLHQMNKGRSGSSCKNYLRPYPLSTGYAYIFDLNKNTPQWFISIGKDLCDAWVDFLSVEILSGHVWLPPERPTVESIPNTEILSGGLKEPAVTSDYGDLNWTTTHRDMLASESRRLDALLISLQ